MIIQKALSYFLPNHFTQSLFNQTGIKFSMRNILFLLIACISVSAILLLLGPVKSVKVFASEQDFEEFLLKQVYDFGYPHERVRSREIHVTANFSRQIITVDINESFPKTWFHKTLADSLSHYGVTTYAVVQMPDPVTEIHLSQDGTVTKTIRLVRTN